VVGKLLRELDYSCQANCKTREGSNHPDRNAQFEHVNATVQAAAVLNAIESRSKSAPAVWPSRGR
jgi:Rhodopirellula transposase DDE domain